MQEQTEANLRPMQRYAGQSLACHQDSMAAMIALLASVHCNSGCLNHKEKKKLACNKARLQMRACMLECLEALDKRTRTKGVGGGGG